MALSCRLSDTGNPDHWRSLTVAQRIVVTDEKTAFFDNQYAQCRKPYYKDVFVMNALRQLAEARLTSAVPVPQVFAGRPQVYLNNLPDSPSSSGLLGYTPQIQELIEDVMPLVGHLAERHQLLNRAVQLFYANPKESLVHNTQRLLKLLQRLQGSNQILVPISASHSMIFHTLRQVVPCAREMQLEDVSLFYIGDQANRNPLQAISSTCDMSFFFHAQY